MAGGYLSSAGMRRLAELMTGESLVVFGDDAGALAAAARAAGVDDMRIAPRLATLEDLFIAATGHVLRDDETASPAGL